MSTSESSAGARAFSGHVPGYLIIFFGALVAVGPVGMNAYIPAIPAIAEGFGIEAVSVNYTLSIFLLGYAAGQLFGGAFSDQIGRKRIGYMGLGLYIGAAVCMVAASSVSQMLVLRFLQAIGGGFATVICMASVRDIYPIVELGRRFATITAIVLVAPLIAPTLGSILLGFGWQYIFVFKAAYASFMLVLYALIVPETAPGHWRALSVRSIFASCYEVLSRRIEGHLVPLRLALTIGFASSVLMNFVTNASTVYLEYFGIAPTAFPWFFAMTVIGFMSMNLYSMRHLRPENSARLFRIGLRVQLVSIGALAIVVVTGAASLWTVVPLLVVTMSTLGLIAPAGSSTFMSFFTRLSGSAASTYTTLMFGFGGLFGALTGVLYDGSLLPLVATMALASVIANLISLTTADVSPGA